MNIRIIALILILLFFSSACFTPALWKATDPNEYIQVSYAEITEKELQAKNVKYRKDDKKSCYYVEKNSFLKLKDYSCRILATPITVVLDTFVAVILIVGVKKTAEVEEKVDEVNKQKEIFEDRQQEQYERQKEKELENKNK